MTETTATGVTDSNFDTFTSIEETSKAHASYNSFVDFFSQMSLLRDKDIEIGAERLAQADEHLQSMPELYYYLDNMPDYVANRIKAQRGKTHAFIAVNREVQALSGRTSRYQTGVRLAAARAYGVEAAERSMSEIETRWRHELALQDLYEDIKQNAIEFASGVDNPNGANHLRAVQGQISTLAINAAKRGNALAYEDAYLNARKVSTTDKLISGLSGALTGYLSGGGSLFPSQSQAAPSAPTVTGPTPRAIPAPAARVTGTVPATQLDVQQIF